VKVLIRKDPGNYFNRSRILHLCCAICYYLYTYQPIKKIKINKTLIFNCPIISTIILKNIKLALKIKIIFVVGIDHYFDRFTIKNSRDKKN